VIDWMNFLVMESSFFRCAIKSGSFSLKGAAKFGSELF
jgi:hypothetical protein